MFVEMYELCVRKNKSFSFDKAKCGVVGVSYNIVAIKREKITALSYSLDILLVSMLCLKQNAYSLVFYIRFLVCISFFLFPLASLLIPYHQVKTPFGSKIENKPTCYCFLLSFFCFSHLSHL